MPDDLAGRVALVTGGGRGVGRAIARSLAASGAHVLVNYFHSADQAAECLAEITAAGGSARLLRGSVAKQSSVTAMFDEIRERHGVLDILVNNAAFGVVRPLADLTERDWNRTLATNLFGALWCSQAAAELMTRGGAIVNLSSFGSRITISDYTAIGVSKAALESLTRYLAVEYAPRGIRVNTASAGLVDNHVAGLWPERGRAAMVDATPLRGLASEQDLADMVCYLAGAQSRWITGQTLLADGGLSLGSALVSTPPEPAPPPAADTDGLVAVVGMGVALPRADSPDELWDLLCQAKPVFSEPGDRFDITRFWSARPTPDHTYARLNGYNHDFLPPHTGNGDARPALAPFWLAHAIRQSLQQVRRHERDRHGCYVGQWVLSGQRFEESLAAAVLTPDRRSWPSIRERLPFAGPLTRDLLPDGIARAAVREVLPHDTEILSLDAACASALYAIDLGVRKLLSGQRDLVVCGGVEEITALGSVLFSALGGLTRSDAVRPFDKAADGTLFTDAACVVALKTLERARADGDRVLGVLAGFGGASDGRGKAIYAPSSTGQTRAMARAHDRVDGQVDWIVAHATGTVAGDSVELSSVDQQAAGRPVVLTSNKSLLGHPGWAAGAVSLVHALLAMDREKIPAQQHFTGLPADARPQAVSVACQDVPWPPRADRPRTAAVSGFGFGGINGHLLVRDRPQPGDRSASTRGDDPLVLVGWSALLPGRPDRDQVQRWLRDGFPRGLTFGATYPDPPFAEVRLPATTLRSTDRTQLMAVQAVELFRQEHGALWSRLAERTGVLAGFLEPPRLFGDAVSRAYGATGPAITEDTLPGLMPNVVAGRVANRLDLHGPSLSVGAGRDSVLAAIDVAEHWLSTGDLDLALLVGVSGNATGWAAELTETHQKDIAEGAFVLAMSRFTVASRLQWPMLATVRTHVPDPGPVRISGTGTDTTFLSADGAVAVLRALTAPADRVLVTGVEDAAAPVEIAPLAAVRRLVMARRPDPGTCVRPESDALPPQCVVLTNDPAVADHMPAHATVVVCTSATTPGEGCLDALVTGEIRHIRVIVSMDTGSPWPNRPGAELTNLHEMYFLAAKAWPEASVVCLLLGAPESPHGSLFTGTTRALSRERPDTEVFALATTETDLPAALAQVRHESARTRPLPVVEYRDGVRYTPHGRLAPAGENPLPVNDDSVIVAAGGARGITAECLLALAGRAKPTMWILGTTQEAVLTADRKEFLRERLAEHGGTPAEHNREFERRLRAHETHQTLSRLRDMVGADRVHYVICDVTDEDQAAEAARLVFAEHNRVDLMVYAAGITRSAVARRKSLADFRAVLATKVTGYHAMRAAFADRVGTWCTFGSISATMGLPGETDYVAGNDYLHAAAAAGDGEFAIGWPAWTGTGILASSALVSAAATRRDENTGLTPREGAAHFLAELSACHRDAPVVHYGGGKELGFYLRRTESVQPSRLADRPPPPVACLLDTCVRPGVWQHRFDEAYLLCHKVGGKPAVPATVELELAAQAAVALVPGTRVRAFTDARFSSFLYAQPSPLCTVTAQVRATGNDHTRVEVTITSDFVHANGTVLVPDRQHARVDVHLVPVEHPPIPPRIPAPHTGAPTRDPFTSGQSPVDLSGPFDVLRACHATGAVVDLSRITEVAALREFHTPAMLLDATARTTALNTQSTAVPVSIAGVDLYTTDNDHSLATTRLTAHAQGTDCHAMTADGRVLARIRNVVTHPEGSR